MKIIDCVPYFNEDKILNLRFEMLNDFVDTFVIVECSHVHSGAFKGQNFNIEKFAKFKNKINYKYVDITEKKELILKSKINSQVVENFQRNYIKEAVKDSDKDDLIIISDCDEIPKLNKELINKISNDKFYKQFFFIQKFYYYRPNLQLFEKYFFGTKQVRWTGSKLVKKSNLSYPQNLRSMPSYSRISIFRRLMQKTKLIENGGWHLSFMQSPEDIQKKISSYSHQEYNNEKFNSIEIIKSKILNKEDLFDRGYVLKYKEDNHLINFMKNNNISLEVS